MSDNKYRVLGLSDSVLDAESCGSVRGGGIRGGGEAWASEKCVCCFSDDKPSEAVTLLAMSAASSGDMEIAFRLL